MFCGQCTSAPRELGTSYRRTGLHGWVVLYPHLDKTQHYSVSSLFCQVVFETPEGGNLFQFLFIQITLADYKAPKIPDDKIRGQIVFICVYAIERERGLVVVFPKAVTKTLVSSLPKRCSVTLTYHKYLIRYVFGVRAYTSNGVGVGHTRQNLVCQSAGPRRGGGDESGIENFDTYP